MIEDDSSDDEDDKLTCVKRGREVRKTESQEAGEINQEVGFIDYEMYIENNDVRFSKSWWPSNGDND